MSLSQQVLIQSNDMAQSDKQTGQILLSPCHFTLKASEQIMIQGESGSGKSVFLRTLALLEYPSQGDIRYLGKKVTAQAILRYRSQVMYVQQTPHLPSLSVQNYLQLPFGFAIHKNKRFDRDICIELLAQFNRTADFLEKETSDLSGGELQIAHFIAILQLSPSVLLLDEPSAALDRQTALCFEQVLTDYIQAKPSERAFVMVTHDPQQAHRLATSHFNMHEGVLKRVSP